MDTTLLYFQMFYIKAVDKQLGSHFHIILLYFKTCSVTSGFKILPFFFLFSVQSAWGFFSVLSVLFSSLDLTLEMYLTFHEPLLDPVFLLYHPPSHRLKFILPISTHTKRLYLHIRSDICVILAWDLSDFMMQYQYLSQRKFEVKTDTNTHFPLNF